MPVMCMPLIPCVLWCWARHGTPHSAWGSDCGAMCLVPAGWFLVSETVPPGHEQAAVLVKDVFFYILDDCLVNSRLQNS